MLKKFVLSLIVVLFAIATDSHSQSISAYQLWNTPSFFRGFNFSYDSPASLQDLINLKASGATIVYLTTEGFLDEAAPYDTLRQNISDLDTRVGYCDAAGVRYALAVRRGPGRGDVYLQSVKLDPISSVWTNKSEQQLYGSMLRWMAARYASDTLFVGITPTTEPNPFSDNPANYCCVDTTEMLKFFSDSGVDFTAITQLWVDSIRAGSKNVPVLIQGPDYSDPDIFPLVPIVNDPYPVYEFHSYRPTSYAEAPTSNSVVYPGQYLNFIPPEEVTFDKAFIKDSVFRFVNAIEKETGAPIFLGEFGLELPQTGGPQFLTDISNIAIENGWAFAYWDWHTKTDSFWNYPKWGGGSWPAILASLVEGKSGVIENAPSTGGLIVSQSSTPGELSVYWPEMEQLGIAADVNIFDILGREVRTLTRNSSRFTMDISGLENGIYILTLRSGDAMAHTLIAGGR